MLENTSTPAKTVWFFVSRLTILGGMALFFYSISFTIAAYISGFIWNVNFFTNPQLINDFETNANVLNSLKLIQVLVTIGAMFIPAWFFPKAIEQNRNTFIGLGLPEIKKFWLFAIGIVLLSVPLISWLVEWNTQLQLPQFLAQWKNTLDGSDELANKLTLAFTNGTTLSDFGINLFIVAIIPAIAEELLFRGALQKFIQYCWGNIHIAVIISATIFSAFHGQFSGFFPRLILGMLLGYLYAYSGSIWPSILTHFINNAIAVSIAHFKLGESSASILSESYHFPLYVVCLSAAACVVLVWQMYINKKTVINETY